MAEVCVIGMGPWGLCALERLVDSARRSPASAVDIHIVEPGRPGGGLYSRAHPDYFILNTPCGQHSMYPFPDLVEEGRLGKGFYEWASEQGYRWQGTDCRVSTTGVPVGPHDFLPRRLMGEYLEWFYQVLLGEAPANVTITHYPTSAVDIEPTAAGRERVHLGTGAHLVVDHVILTAGHMTPAVSTSPAASVAMNPYPIEPYVNSTGPHEKVAIEGMGLVAVDVIAALTVGLGGRFTSEPGGRLRYHRSGREPSLYVFSRRGFPYCAKPTGAADPVGDYKPAICTLAAIGNLHRRGPDGTKRQIEARHELLPLVFAEMELCYYTRCAAADGGDELARDVREKLVYAWATGTFEELRSTLGDRYGRFVASEYFFVGEGDQYLDGEDYKARVYETVAADVREALATGGGSAVKAALETLRALRDTIRMAVEFKGLTLSSHLDFVANMHSRFARLVAGPPLARSQQLLALIDAGVVNLSFGPSPELVARSDGRVLVRSTRLAKPFEVVVDRVVRAHVDLPSLVRSASPLMANLVKRGRARPLTFDGTPVGSIDLTEEFHPLNDGGGIERRLWVFGAVTEGVRYFTLYIPSPKSRSRAFIDAGICADEVVRTDTTIVLDGTSGPALVFSSGPAPTSALASLPFSAVGDELIRYPAPAPARGQAMRVALVNNMPDGAFEETERQFRALLEANAAGRPVVLSLYSLPGTERQANVQAVIDQGYRQLSDLYLDPPDAVVVTGAEPKKADLSEEPYWPALEELLWWARSSVAGMLVSCMSAHGALWSFDRRPRRLLAEKCSGVFDQVFDETHPLMAGIDRLSLPHSRFNEIPAQDLLDSGYQVLAQSQRASWSVAWGERDQCQVLLLQGHPEYGEHTLLREYRRDVRRYLSGHQGSYPRIPTDYLDAEGTSLLARFERDVVDKCRDPALMEGFPFDLAARHVGGGWESASRVLVGNWLQSIDQPVGQPGATKRAATGASALQ